MGSLTQRRAQSHGRTQIVIYLTRLKDATELMMGFIPQWEATWRRRLKPGPTFHVRFTRQSMSKMKIRLNIIFVHQVYLILIFIPQVLKIDIGRFRVNMIQVFIEL